MHLKTAFKYSENHIDNEDGEIATGHKQFGLFKNERPTLISWLVSHDTSNSEANEFCEAGPFN